MSKGNEFSIYEAPKNGGTTIRIWLYYKLTKDLIRDECSTGYYTGTSEMTTYLTSNGYFNRTFESVITPIKIVIKRDPLERFVSLFNDKIIKDQWLQSTSVEMLLDEYSEKILNYNGNNANELLYHFCPQANHFSNNINYFNYVFSTSEINSSLRLFLEELWRMKLPMLHARNSTSWVSKENGLTLTAKQKNLIYDFYSTDYNYGYC